MKRFHYWVILILLLLVGCKSKKDEAVVITSIGIETKDNLSVYQNDTIDKHLNNFFVVVNYSNKKKEVVKINKDMVTIFDTTKETEGLIEVALHGKKAQKTFGIAQNVLVDFDIKLIDGRKICLNDTRDLHLDSFDIIGTYINGEKKRVEVKVENIKTFDTSTLGRKIIVFNFASIEKNLQVEIEENRVVDYELLLKNNPVFVEGDTLAKHMSSFMANEIYLNGTKKELVLEEKNIWSFNTKTLGKKYISLNVGYRAKARLEIEVVPNTVVDYEIKAKTTSVFLQYENKSKHLNSFEGTGTFLNGDQKKLVITAENIAVFNTETVGPNKVEFVFDNVKKIIDIDVKRNEIIDFEVSPKVDAKFVQGDSLVKHLTNFSVLATFSNGTTGNINLKESDISGFDTRTTGVKNLIVTLENVQKTLNIEVVPNEFVNYEILLKEGRHIVEGDSLSKHIDSFSIYKVYTNGSKTKLNYNGESIKGFDTSTIGIKTLTLNLESVDVQFDIEVVPNRVVDLDIKVKNGVVIVKDDSISKHLTSFELKEIYLNGDIKEVEMSYQYLKYFSSFWIGKNIMKFKFGEGGAEIKEFEITVVPNRVVRLDLSLREGVEFFVGDTLDQHFDSIIVKEIYLNDDEEIKVIETDDVTNFDTSKVGQVDVTIDIKGVSATITLNIIDKKINDTTDFTYSTTTGGIIITDYVGTSKQVTIPSEIDGQKVVILGEKSFYKKGLITVSIPNTVEKIGEYAFFNNNLSTLYIPDSVTDIEFSAFAWNKGLREVRLPTNLKVINASTFLKCAIRSIHIPDSVKAILDGAFKENEIVDLKLSKNLIYIWHDAFSWNNIEKVVIPEGMTHIGWNTFELNNIKELVLPESLTYIGQNAFSYNELVEVKLPQGLEVLEDFSFSGNNLEKVNIPPKITVLNNCVFSGNNLRSIVIPETVTQLEYGTLKHNNLEEIVIPNTVTKIGRDNLVGNNELKKVTMPKILESEISKNFLASQLEQIEFVFTEAPIN